MNDARYKGILYVIVTVILVTISIQVYWNYKNYLNNKQQFINDVQISLDNAVDTYYTNLAKKSTIGFTLEGNAQLDFFAEDGKLDSIMNTLKFTENGIIENDSINIRVFDGVNVFRGKNLDSAIHAIEIINTRKAKHRQAKIYFDTNKISQDLDFKILTSKVVFSINNDSIQLKEIDTLLSIELQRKNITVNHSLSLRTPIDSSLQYFNEAFIKNAKLTTSTKSAYLPIGSQLKVHFGNATKAIFGRMLLGILISTILVLIVISLLFYLLKIIKHQKQLAEVKNDLISNITHEFKTPIATISVALESIKNFDVIDNKEKTKTYLDMSSNQLSKLNVMVEKLLETATLDSENLSLNKDVFDLVNLLRAITEKYSMTLGGKTLKFVPSAKIINSKIDVFHFENAISNIIDNAIKYGGNNITVNLNQDSKHIYIEIIDDGISLTKANLNRIFEKFYRVPKGNTHDIKGFGIGLYYTQKIIEKHEGTIQVFLNNAVTNFKIKLPNG